MNATRAIEIAAAAVRAENATRTASTRRPTVIESRYGDLAIVDYATLTVTNITNDEVTAVDYYPTVERLRAERESIRATFADREF